MQPGVLVQDQSRFVGALQALEGRATVRAEPGLHIEVVHRNEIPLAAWRLDEPVVAAEALWDVAQPLDVQTPGVSEPTSNVMLPEAFGRGHLHDAGHFFTRTCSRGSGI